jgi:drug/metabolite transporter (DMT)-like permease
VIVLRILQIFVTVVALVLIASWFYAMKVEGPQFANPYFWTASFWTMAFPAGAIFLWIKGEDL